MENEERIIYYIDHLETEKTSWYKKLKGKMRWKCYKTRAFVKDHWAEIIVYTPVAVAAAVSVVKFGKLLIPHKTAAEMEMEMKNLTYYDRHTNMRFDLNRKLSNEEKTEILNRIGEGERVDDILKDLRVLKG